MFVKDISYEDLRTAIERAEKSKSMADRLFVGFKTPVHVEVAFGQAEAIMAQLEQWKNGEDQQASLALLIDATRAYNKAKMALDIALMAFFRKSHVFFGKQLSTFERTLDADLRLGKKLRVSKKLEEIESKAADKRIDLREASTLYYTVHNLLKELEAEQRKREVQRTKAKYGLMRFATAH